MAEKSGEGSDTPEKANAKAKLEGANSPRKSSVAQSEPGNNGGETS